MYEHDYPSEPLFSPLNRDISIHLMHFLDGDDLVRLRQVSSKCESYVASTIHKRTRSIFKDSIRDYDHLVQLFDSSSTVIGGLAAIHILFPFHLPPPRITLYTPFDSFRAVAKHFVRREHFNAAIVPPPAGSQYPPGVAKILRLTNGVVTIDLIQSTARSPLLPIASEWNSALFAYVAARTYCCAYPSLVRSSRALLNPTALTELLTIPDTLKEDLDSFTRAGWDVQLDWSLWCPTATCDGVHSLGCAAAVRSFGDRFCFRGHSIPIRKRPQRTGRDLVEGLTAVWWRGGLTCTAQCHNGQILVAGGARSIIRAAV